MYRTVNDFKSAWMIERDATLQCFRSLTDDSLRFHSTAFPRGLGRIAYHILEAPKAILGDAGLQVTGPAFGHEATSASHLIADYERASNAVLGEVAKWSDSDLVESIDFFGHPMPRGMLLNTLITHQAHHRGQLTVLMREAGISIPSFYGPTLEAWRAMGREPA